MDLDRIDDMLAANPYHLLLNWFDSNHMHRGIGTVSSQSLDTSPFVVFHVVGVIDLVCTFDFFCGIGPDGDVSQAGRAEAPERGCRAGDG